MKFEDLNEREIKILRRVADMIVERRPFEEIVITTDRNGKAETLIVSRSQKIILNAFTA